MQIKKQQLELDMEKQIGSKLRKNYVKPVYCYISYLTSMQSTSWASLLAQVVRNPPAMQENLVWFLGQEDSLEKGQATHSSILGFSW